MLARQTGADLALLAIVDDAAPADVTDAQVMASEKALNSLIERDCKGLDVDLRVRPGDPTAEILAETQKTDPALLVLGVHRPRAFFDAVRETTGQRITRLSATPVLMVSEPVSGPHERVIVATDFSPASAAAASLAAELCPDAPITPVHALHIPYRGMLARHDSGALEASFRREAREADAAWRADQTLPGRIGETRMDAGSAHQILGDELRRGGPALLALGAHGRVGQQRALLGSLVTDLMRDPPADLLICRPRQGD